MVVAFPGNQFKGEIAPALGDLVDNGTIRVLDLAFIIKDAEGNVVGAELEDAGSEVINAFEALTFERGGLISDNDIIESARRSSRSRPPPSLSGRTSGRPASRMPCAMPAACSSTSSASRTRSSRQPSITPPRRQGRSSSDANATQRPGTRRDGGRHRRRGRHGRSRAPSPGARSTPTRRPKRRPYSSRRTTPVPLMPRPRTRPRPLRPPRRRRPRST